MQARNVLRMGNVVWNALMKIRSWQLSNNKYTAPIKALYSFHIPAAEIGKDPRIIKSFFFQHVVRLKGLRFQENDL